MQRANNALKIAAAVGIAASALSGTLGGCAARDASATFAVEEGSYDRAFLVTRDVLRDANFEIERVDAVRGVITTRARGDAGFFTPWTGYQLDAASAFEGSLNQQRRRVRVAFIPVADEAAYAGGGGDQDRIGSQLDQVASRGPWTAYVDVGVTRMQTYGLRPPPRAVLLSSVSVDPIAQAQGVSTIYEVPVSQDTAMAAAITRRIRTRLGIEAPPAAKALARSPGQPTPIETRPVEPSAAEASPAEPSAVEARQVQPSEAQSTTPQPAPQPDAAPVLVPVPPRR